MCGECVRAMIDKGLIDEYKNGGYFQHSLTPGEDSHGFYKGKRLCEKWWEETVVGVAGGEGYPFGWP